VSTPLVEKQMVLYQCSLFIPQMLFTSSLRRSGTPLIKTVYQMASGYAIPSQSLAGIPQQTVFNFLRAELWLIIVLLIKQWTVREE